MNWRIKREKQSENYQKKKGYMTILSLEINLFKPAQQRKNVSHIISLLINIFDLDMNKNMF